MGVLTFFEKNVDALINSKKKTTCQVVVCDNHGVPELLVGPEDVAHVGWTVMFKDWHDFKEFAQAVDDVYTRLRGAYE